MSSILAAAVRSRLDVGRAYSVLPAAGRKNWCSGSRSGLTREQGKGLESLDPDGASGTRPKRILRGEILAPAGRPADTDLVVDQRLIEAQEQKQQA